MLTNPDPRLPLYQQLRDEIAQKIERQEWKFGEAIPSELELTKTYAIATGTVRKAIEALIAEGLLERSRGKGTFVRRPRFDMFRFFRFESAERPIPKSRILKREAMAAPSDVATALKLKKGERVIRILRQRLVDDQPLLVDEIWLPLTPFSALLDIEPGEFGDLLYPMYEKHCGQVVASAKEILTVERVTSAYARLLQLPPDTPVIVIERIALGFDGTHLEWRRSRGPAERFTYHVEIR
jgi:GntR family transcriptional regulator